ncbi:MAG: hypothetical protein DMD95_10400 [Candidatus Rokuibacteriota bacterium]|nr:MAG: hypothetical protein DMD95_10400 [Candidatus Rokubacteria bacterium]
MAELSLQQATMIVEAALRKARETVERGAGGDGGERRVLEHIRIRSIRLGDVAMVARGCGRGDVSDKDEACALAGIGAAKLVGDTG